MRRELTKWFSPALQEEMPIAVYGHHGFALLLIPTAAADYLEYERFQMLEVLKPYIEAGKVKVFSINSINNQSWLNNKMDPSHKAIRHNQFNDYVFNEVVPFIKANTSPETPIITSGASFGALHSMNLFLKRPDLINGTIAMSGVYDLHSYTKGFNDLQTYLNSPMSYMPKLDDQRYLNKIRESNHIHILTGSGDYEDPEASKAFAGVLRSKGINCELDVWGPDMKHDWPTWRAMLPYYIDSRF